MELTETTLTHEQIDALSGSEVERAVGERVPDPTGYFDPNDTAAALALLRETGQTSTITQWPYGERPFEAIIETGRGRAVARGDTVAEACLKAWLKWKLAQG